MKTRLNKYRTLTIPFLGLYAWLLIYTAWVSDDGFITLRSVENFIHGYGMAYNVGERVQTFTHPMWFLLQSVINFIFLKLPGNPLGGGQAYYLNVCLSIFVSLAAVFFFSFKIASSTRNAILGLTIFSVSKAFLDFSTSGLENPLSHLMLVFFIWFLFAGDKTDSTFLFTLALFAGLGALNRLDTILFYTPTLALAFWKSANKPKAVAEIGIGLFPIIAWEIFSIFYYGTPFPNTAFAKIGTGIAATSLFKQGAFYYLRSIQLDPVTLLVILAGIILSFVSNNNHKKTIMAGMVLYLAYILYIGGDFMSGRYFSAPLLAATSLITVTEYKSAKFYALLLGMVLVIGLAPIFVIPERSFTFGAGSNDYRIVMEHDITDERLIYMRSLGLWQNLEGGGKRISYPHGEWIYHSGKTTKVKVVGPLGVAGYRFGPNVHVIDINALADPLMARLPLQDPNSWRIGHFRHMIPDGYIETLESGKNKIADKNIALFYDKLSLVVKGDLWSWERMVTIWNLNTGGYDYLLREISPEIVQ